jgi:single stranded DNA-binding protein
MLNARNNITVYGNIFQQPEITQSKGGSKVVRFTLVADKYKRDAEGKVTRKKELYKAFAYGEMANFLENHGEIGTSMYIHGKLVNRTYFGRNGQPRKTTEIAVNHVMGVSSQI